MTDQASSRSYDFRIVPIDLIDEPIDAMRESMDDEKMSELAASIREVGLKQPIGVRPVGDRFRVSYGHRRRIACGIAGETHIPCIVLADDDDTEEGSKLIENWIREDTNAAEDATYLAHILDKKYNGDIELMCRSLGVKESRVNGRLDLLRGDPNVFEALRGRKINLAVARELNKIRDASYRGLYLDDAIKQGATASVVAQWRMNVDRLAAIQRSEQSGEAAAVSPSTEAPLVSVDHCLLCALDSDQHDMEYAKVHRSCHTAHRRLQRAAMEGK